MCGYAVRLEHLFKHTGTPQQWSGEWLRPAIRHFSEITNTTLARFMLQITLYNMALEVSDE